MAERKADPEGYAVSDTSEREFLMTGITAEEWDNAFKGGS